MVLAAGRRRCLSGRSRFRWLRSLVAATRKAGPVVWSAGRSSSVVESSLRSNHPFNMAGVHNEFPTRVRVPAQWKVGPHLAYSSWSADTPVAHRARPGRWPPCRKLVRATVSVCSACFSNPVSKTASCSCAVRTSSGMLGWPAQFLEPQPLCVGAVFSAQGQTEFHPRRRYQRGKASPAERDHRPAMVTSDDADIKHAGLRSAQRMVGLFRQFAQSSNRRMLLQGLCRQSVGVEALLRPVKSP